MAKRRTVGKRQPRKAVTRQPEPVDDDLALADELIRIAREDQPVIEAEWDKFMKGLGIDTKKKPIGAKRLRERILKRGLIKPESNEFSRGIIEMREE
jgi:DNA/RNA-binding domain of Phe-tRNA-synthetase-like protein